MTGMTQLVDAPTAPPAAANSTEAAAPPPVVEELVAALAREAGPSVPLPVIERCVTEEVARFCGARIRAFVPLLVHKAVRDRLVRTTSAARPPATSGGDGA